MRRLGQGLSAVGVACIILPVLAVLSRALDGPELALATARAPTFVLGGLFLFVVGIGIRLIANG